LKKLNNIGQNQNKNIRQKIDAIVSSNFEVLTDLYKDFENRLFNRPLESKLLEEKINKIKNPLHQKVMKSFYLFNQVYFIT
jgi:hypothetical protein